MSNNLSTITEVCKDCGKEFKITPKEQLFALENSGFVLPKRCPECREIRRNGMKMITCVDCGEKFKFSIDEQSYYAEHGFDEPKRCPKCRKARKDRYNGQSIAKEDK